MTNKALADNARLLLYAINETISSGANPQALAYFREAANALAAGRFEEYAAFFQLGEQYAIR